MKQSAPHERLTDAQAAEVQSAQATQIEKQKVEITKAQDHALRWRCIEAAIKSIDASPDLHVESAADVNISVDVVQVARNIYSFVTE